MAYVQDPKKWLRQLLDDKRARAKMTFRVREEEDAINLYAFLASLAPAPEAAEMEKATEEVQPSN